ncbi:MAG: SpoIIE family protein phosphatase [Planctomycetota bacterium]
MPENRGWSPSLREFIWLIALGPTLIAGLTVLVLSERAAESIASDLTERYVREAQGRVRQQVGDYLRSAIIASDLTARRIAHGEFDPDALGSWLSPALDQIESIPDIASITFGDHEGRTFWVVRTPSGYECALKLDASADSIREYAVVQGTRQLGDLIRTSPFDALGRPWYRAAMGAESPVWSDVYSWVGGDNGAYAIGSAYVRQIHGADGAFLGVLSIDVTLGALSDFLASVPIAQTGTLLLTDPYDRLLAASHAPVLDGDGRQTGVSDGLAELDSKIEPGDSDRRSGTLRGQPARYAITTLSTSGFENLRLYIALPEADLLASVKRTRERLLLAGGGVILVVASLSIALSSGITRRMRSVNSHVRAVSEGDFESRLDESGPKEWRILAGDLNQMAEDLETYLETQKGLEVAMEVQQALLPESVPEPEGLEVAGHSKYCDETGGDYYDFLELSQSGATGQLVAVGDVMGHGVAAALLMATARAALRAHAPTSGSLGRLMTRVNDVLAADARHGRFMTLSILVFEPSDRSVRWSSAGHDPAIVVDPETGEVAELEGGDMPLGITEGVDYEEYTETKLPQGALVLVGTDGVWEMANDDGEMYGKDRLLGILREMRKEPVQRIIDAIDRDLVAFRSGAPVKDDVTFVVVRFA